MPSYNRTVGPVSEQFEYVSQRGTLSSGARLLRRLRCLERNRIAPICALYQQANIAYQKAFNVAQELENPELLASALARQGVALVQQHKSQQAILYLDNALDIIEDQNLPKLRGYILQALSEANAQDQRVHESWLYLD